VAGIGTRGHKREGERKGVKGVLITKVFGLNTVKLNFQGEELPRT